MVEEKILIVDDDDVELKRDSDILTSVGYEVIGCKSGAEALEYLNNNPVELVLLDVNMPGMNGYDVCLNIRKHRWITKGLKKNQGKYIYLNIIGVRRRKKNQRTRNGSKTTRMV